MRREDSRLLMLREVLLVSLSDALVRCFSTGDFIMRLAFILSLFTFLFFFCFVFANFDSSNNSHEDISSSFNSDGTLGSTSGGTFGTSVLDPASSPCLSASRKLLPCSISEMI